RNDDFEWIDGCHDPRHAGRPAGETQGITVSSRGLVGEALLDNGLVLCGQRRLLSAAARLARVPLGAADPVPLPRQIGIFAFVERLRPGDRHCERRRERDCTYRASIKHGVLRVIDPNRGSAGALGWGLTT